MSFEAVNWAVETRIGSCAAAKLILMLLADQAAPAEGFDGIADGEHVTWVGVERLAHQSELSVRRVRELLAHLSRAGLIKRLDRWRRNGSQTSSYTILNMEVRVAAPPVSCEEVSRTPAGASPRTPRERAPAPPEPSVEPSDRTVSSSTSAADASVASSTVEGEIVDDAKTEALEVLNAGTMTKKWIEYCSARGVQLPPVVIKRFAAKFKELIKAGFDPHLIGAALQAMSRDNAMCRPTLLDNYLVRVQAGKMRHPDEFRTAHEKRQDMAAEADMVLPLAEKIAAERGVPTHDYFAFKKIRDEVKSMLRTSGGMVRAYTDVPRLALGS